jgi:hypothetical protein
MFSDWVSFLVYPNLFGIKGFVVVVVVAVVSHICTIFNVNRFYFKPPYVFCFYLRSKPIQEFVCVRWAEIDLNA